MRKLFSRVIYFAYYLRSTDFAQLRKYMKEALFETGTGYVRQSIDVVLCSFRHNLSPIDYYQFEFPTRTHSERSEYVGTGAMYEYQLRMNPVRARNILNDKRSFLEAFSPWVQRGWNTIDKKSAGFSRHADLNTELLVLKDSHGQAGRDVKVVVNPLSSRALLSLMQRDGFDLVEEYIEQHPILAAVHPNSLNTIRIITEVTEDQVTILGARVRFGNGRSIDNLAQGGIACVIDTATGVVDSDGFSTVPQVTQYSRHPMTGVEFQGINIPFWEELIEISRRAAQAHPENRSVGWDLAVTTDGIELIEGNHNWCKSLWQVPAQRGLKSLLRTEG